MPQTLCSLRGKTQGFFLSWLKYINVFISSSLLLSDLWHLDGETTLFRGILVNKSRPTSIPEEIIPSYSVYLNILGPLWVHYWVFKCGKWSQKVFSHGSWQWRDEIVILFYFWPFDFVKAGVTFKRRNSLQAVERESDSDLIPGRLSRVLWLPSCDSPVVHRCCSNCPAKAKQQELSQSSHPHFQLKLHPSTVTVLVSRDRRVFLACCGFLLLSSVLRCWISRCENKQNLDIWKINPSAWMKEEDFTQTSAENQPLRIPLTDSFCVHFSHFCM